MGIRIATVLAVALGMLVVPGVAHADPHEHHGDAVRYASVKGCAAKDGNIKPCGAWRLVMHSGKQQLLKDAQVVARTAGGKSSVYQAAPIAVSGNGQRIAYFTKKGSLAVRTLGGGVVELALPRVNQFDVSLQLSDDGSRLAADLQGERPKGLRVFDTASGALLGTIPKTEWFVGFSGDGGEVLTKIENDEGSTELHVYSESGDRLLGATVPQVVAFNGSQALAADGKTTASVVLGSKPQLVLYDLQTDQVTGRVKVKLPAGDLYKIDWTGESQVTLHLATYPDGKPTRMRIVQIDTGSGAVKLRDSYTLLADTYVFAACGG